MATDSQHMRFVVAFEYETDMCVCVEWLPMLLSECRCRTMSSVDVGCMHSI